MSAAALVVDATPRWVFLAKPAGVPVFPSRAGPGPSVLAALLLAAPDAAELPAPDGFAGGILHRLDTGTSGLVIAARTLPDLRDGRALFAAHGLDKRYRFLAARDVPWDEHAVDAELAHDPRDRRKMVWRRGRATPHRGRWLPARTALRRLGRRGGRGLWEARIATGVTHQIRVHAAAVGLPLDGDRLYGGGVGDGRFWLHHERVDGWPGGTPALPLPEDWPT